MKLASTLALALLLGGCESRQQKVKTEFLHAWRNYERYAWGHDALRPLSKTPHDWYGQSLLMTPVDALDTLVLMKLDAEAAKAKALIVNDLSFDRDIYVKNFEITIRLLGGLLSSYQLTGDKRLLHLAEDLGNRLLPVFNSPTRLPYVYVNLRTGQIRDPVTNPAETGTLLLEFGTLSKLTGSPFSTRKQNALWLKRSSDALRSGSSAKALTWTQGLGRMLTVTSAVVLIRTTNICGSAGFFSAIRIVATCGMPVFQPSTNILPTKSAAASGTATRICRQVSGLRQSTARSMHSSLRCSPSPAMWSAHVACKLHRSRCGTCTASSRKLSITKRCAWWPEVIICVPKSLSLLIIFTVTRVTRNIGAWARKCSMISLNIVARSLVTLRLPT